MDSVSKNVTFERILYPFKKKSLYIYNLYMKAFIERPPHGGGNELQPAQRRGNLSQPADFLREARIPPYLSFKKNLRSIRPLIIEIQLSEILRVEILKNPLINLAVEIFFVCIKNISTAKFIRGF